MIYTKETNEETPEKSKAKSPNKTKPVPKADSTKSEPVTKTKTKKYPIKILSYIIFGIFALLTTVLIAILTWISILPIKFLLPVILVLILLAVILGFFTFKKSFKKPVKITCVVLEIIFSVIIALALVYLGKTINFFDRINSGDYQIEEYYVIVKKDSSYNDISDLNNHSVATYKDNSESYQSALTELSNLINYDNKPYTDFIDASTALLEQNTDSVLLKGSLKAIVEEIVPDFNNQNVKILYTISIKTKIETSEANSIDISNEPFNIFISGIDTYGPINTVSRSDVNMIMTVNPKTHQILLTSIPRDYYVQLHDTTGPRDKLTHAGIYGVDMSRQTLEDLFGINIDYFVRINFSSAIDLINAIDGVEVTPDATFNARSNRSCHFDAGQTIHVYGDCALAYARERYAYATGDRHRVQNQQEVLTAIINKITSSKTLITKYSDILSSMGESLQTNIPSSQIYKLVNTQLDSMPSWSIDRISVDGTGSMDITYSTGSQVLYVMIPNQETVDAAIHKINTVLDPDYVVPGADTETETESQEEVSE